MGRHKDADGRGRTVQQVNLALQVCDLLAGPQKGVGEVCILLFQSRNLQPQARNGWVSHYPPPYLQAKRLRVPLRHGAAFAASWRWECVVPMTHRPTG